MFRFPPFPKEAPYGFYRIGEKCVPYQGFVHYLTFLVESSQFAEHILSTPEKDERSDT